MAIAPPDVVVADIQMPPTHGDDGLRAAIEIRQRWPGVGVLVLSQYLEEGYALALIGEDAGGVGYLLKDRIGDVAAFADAVTRVGTGGSALDPAVVTQMVGRRRRAGPLDELTGKERAVLELMAEGRSNQGIAERLVVSPGREAQGYFQMPGGPVDHPLSPFYGAGHEAWAKGEPRPLLPGATQHTLRLVPTPQ